MKVCFVFVTVSIFIAYFFAIARHANPNASPMKLVLGKFFVPIYCNNSHKSIVKNIYFQRKSGFHSKNFVLATLKYICGSYYFITICILESTDTKRPVPLDNIPNHPCTKSKYWLFVTEVGNLDVWGSKRLGTKKLSCSWILLNKIEV